MPNDVITLKALVSELSMQLGGGRIEKIYQHDKFSLTFRIKNNGVSHQFFVSANPNTPSAYISTQKYENPINAPAFCMLLRKHLTNSIIKSIEIFNFDRVIKISFDARDDLNDKVEFCIFIELLGRYSNIIFTDANLQIIDAIKRIYLDQSIDRHILPNMQYAPLLKNKISLHEHTDIENLLAQQHNIDADFLFGNISGISKETAKEIATSAHPQQMLKTLQNINNSQLYKPCLLVKNNKITDYFVMPYQSINGEYQFFSSLNDAVDFFFTTRTANENNNEHTKLLNKMLKKAQNRVLRRINDNKERIKLAESADKYQQLGNLIISNIYLIDKNTEELYCFDYYNNMDIKIPLDKNLTPAQNAQVYFKKYNKLKKTKQMAQSQLAELIEQESYLQSIAVSIQQSTQKIEYQEILEELQSLMNIKNNTAKKKPKTAMSKPMKMAYNDCIFYWGKNNKQNNEVTFKIANNNDTWFHVKHSHGTHLIVKGTINDQIIVKAAEIAAYYSQAKNAENIEVDYCLKKYVKKIPTALMGMVTYTQYKSILVTPKSENDINK